MNKLSAITLRLEHLLIKVTTTVLSTIVHDRGFEDYKGGDSAEIGERGINISGGQKARVALARAVLES